MNIKSVFSTKASAAEAVLDLKAQLAGFDTKVLIIFASSSFDQIQLNKLIKEAFNDSEIFGCSTSGEITSGRVLKNSVVAMAFDSNVVDDLKIEVIENIKNNASAKTAFKSFEDYFGKSMNEIDIDKYIGIVLVDGLSGTEERLMDSIGDMTNVSFIGGSAGDDLKFECTYVYADGKVYTNAAVLVLMKLKTKFEIIKTQSFNVLDAKLKVTKVNENTREVISFNNKPAVQAYAEAVGVSADQAPNYFMSNPVGLVADQDNVYVRSPQKVEGESIIFYCSIAEGLEVSLLESTDIVKDTKAAVADKKNKLGKISGLINFNCILRTLELESKGKTGEYGEIFKDIPTIGFSTYGEEYIGHINQTATMLVFK